MSQTHYQTFLNLISKKKNALAILIDPDKFNISETKLFLNRIPKKTTHLFVGGSTVDKGSTQTAVLAIKMHSNLPVFLFPGDYQQITQAADVLLFLSLLSGRNAEYLVGQQVKAVSNLVNTNIEIIPTGYILVDGGNESAVARISNTLPMSQENVNGIIDTAIAGQYMGASLIYLEAGSGAKYPVQPHLIERVKSVLNVPLIVGGGIKTELQMEEAYDAGANMIVMNSLFRNHQWQAQRRWRGGFEVFGLYAGCHP